MCLYVLKIDVLCYLIVFDLWGIFFVGLVPSLVMAMKSLRETRRMISDKKRIPFKDTTNDCRFLIKTVQNWNIFTFTYGMCKHMTHEQS